MGKGPPAALQAQNDMFMTAVFETEAAITAAGGTVERVPLPYAQGRPSQAAGNALMNR